MKRIISFVLILVLALCAAGCRTHSNEGADPAENAVSEQPSEQTQEPTEEPAEEPSSEPTAEPTVEPTEEPEADLPEIIQGDGVFFLVNPDSTIYAWGDNQYGQLGTGDTQNRTKPAFIGFGIRPVIVGDTVFALSSDNILWGWGRNDMGQLGVGDAEDRTKPVELMYSVKQIVRGWNSFYALTEGGEVYGWGVLSGTEPTVESYEPQLLFENVEQFSQYWMIKDGGDLWMRRGDWEKVAEGAVRVFDKGGFMSYFEREDGMLCCINDRNEVEPVCDNVLDVQISDGCAIILKNDGSVWSYETGGEFHEVPEEEQGQLTFIMDGVIKIRCDWEMDEDWGYNYNFALKENGELWTWSAHYSNELVGKEQDDYSSEPVCVAENVKSFVTNNAQTFIVKNDGTVWATGMGSEDYIHGCIGDGTDETRYGFVDLGLKDIRKVFSRLTEEYIDFDDGTDGVELYARTFAVDANGRIFAWGWNGDGLLGVNALAEEVLSPEEVFLTK